MAIHINELTRRARDMGYKFSKSSVPDPDSPSYTPDCEQYIVTKVDEPHQFPVSFRDEIGGVYHRLTLQDIESFVFGMLKPQL